MQKTRFWSVFQVYKMKKKRKFLKRFSSLKNEKARFWSAFKFTKWKNTYVNIGIFAKWSISQHRAHKQREILVGILYCKIKVPSTDTHSGNPYIDFFRKSQSLQYSTGTDAIYGFFPKISKSPVQGTHTGHSKQSPSACLQGPHTEGKHKFQSPQ